LLDKPRQSFFRGYYGLGVSILPSSHLFSKSLTLTNPPPAADYARTAGFNADEAKQKLFLREEKDFALPRFLFWGGGVSAAQEGAEGMRGGF